MRIFLSVLFLASLILSGCTKELSEPEPLPGLDTVPFYRRGSASFDSVSGIKELEEKKQALESSPEAFSAEVKKRVETKGVKIEMPDPWIPPAMRNPEDLPGPLKRLPKDKFGYPDWVASVAGGFIKPRNSITGTPIEEQIIDTDIVFEINDKLMRNVLFPHTTHTYWLSCKVCHPAIFKPKKGANIFSMYDIWNGQYCGRCHGKVAFQPKGFDNCRRCHKVPKKTMGPK